MSLVVENAVTSCLGVKARKLGSWETGAVIDCCWRIFLSYFFSFASLCILITSDTWLLADLRFQGCCFATFWLSLCRGSCLCSTITKLMCFFIWFLSKKCSEFCSEAILWFFTMCYVSSPFVYIVFNERNLCFHPVTSSMPTAAPALPFTVIH